ncbi:MAG: energy transducer TonB [Opitutaceae bacterium]|nr:energy transducer TonB [Opitutaceae bacterium]
MNTIRANSPAALFLSLLLHGTVVALMVFMAHFLGQQAEKPPAIFELVAGPPTAPDELVAPALGSPAAKVTLKVPAAAATPPKPSPSPPIEAAEVAPPAPKPAPKPPPKPAPKSPPKPAPSKTATTNAKAAPREAPKTPRMSKQEFEKRYGKPQASATAPSSSRPIKAPRIDTRGIANGVIGGSTANTRGGGGGRAMSREQMDAMTEYFLKLRVRLQQALEKPAGVSDQLRTEVEFLVAANGQIDNVRILRSSGNAEFDQCALDAFRKIAWLGARPDGKSDTRTVTFQMKDD